MCFYFVCICCYPIGVWVQTRQSNVSQYAFAFDKYSTSDNHLTSVLTTTRSTLSLYQWYSTQFRVLNAQLKIYVSSWNTKSGINFLDSVYNNHILEQTLVNTTWPSKSCIMVHRYQSLITQLEPKLAIPLNLLILHGLWIIQN